MGARAALVVLLLLAAAATTSGAAPPRTVPCSEIIDTVRFPYAG